MEKTSFTGKAKDEKAQVKNLKVGTRVFERFVMADKPALRKTKKKKPFFVMTMGDFTGKISVYVWGVPLLQAESELEKLTSGKVYVLAGAVKEYNGEVKIDIDWQDFVNHFRLCDDSEVVQNDYSMVVHSKRDVDRMLYDIMKRVNKVENKTYKSVLAVFFSDEEWVSRFKHAAAAKRRHHNWIAGLIEHVWSMLQIMDRVVEVHPYLDKDLMTTAIILHDISKMDDYAIGLTITMTDHKEVLMAGHMATAQMEIERRLFSSDEEYDLNDFRKLLHLIHSHHGPAENGWGSSVSPMLPEAYAMHFIDNLDAKVTESHNLKKN